MDTTRLEDKLDRVVESVNSIDKTLAGQAVQLEEHIRRTALLEAQVEPLKAHVARLHGMAALLGFLMGGIEILKHFWEKM